MCDEGINSVQLKMMVFKDTGQDMVPQLLNCETGRIRLLYVHICKRDITLHTILDERQTGEVSSE